MRGQLHPAQSTPRDGNCNTAHPPQPHTLCSTVIMRAALLVAAVVGALAGSGTLKRFVWRQLGTPM